AHASCDLGCWSASLPSFSVFFSEDRSGRPLRGARGKGASRRSRAAKRPLAARDGAVAPPAWSVRRLRASPPDESVPVVQGGGIRDEIRIAYGLCGEAD